MTAKRKKESFIRPPHFLVGVILLTISSWPILAVAQESLKYSKSIEFGIDLSDSDIENTGNLRSLSFSVSPTWFLTEAQEVGITAIMTWMKTRSVLEETGGLSLSETIQYDLSGFYRYNYYFMEGRAGVYGGGQAGIVSASTESRTILVQPMLQDTTQTIDSTDFSFGPQFGFVFFIAENLSWNFHYQYSVTQIEGLRGTTSVLIGLKYYY